MPQFVATPEITTWTEAQAKQHGLVATAIPDPRTLPKAGLKDFPNFVGANANLAAGIIVSFVNVNTLDNNSGTGWAFGLGAGLEVTGGTLGYGSWETVKSERNVIAIVATEDILTITFTLSSSPLVPVAVFVGAGIGGAEFIAGGEFTWN